MIVTAAQIRQARALLRWTSPRLARTAGVSFDTALKAQNDEAMPTLPSIDVWAIRTALEKAGVRFAFDAEASPSVALVKPER